MATDFANLPMWTFTDRYERKKFYETDAGLLFIKMGLPGLFFVRLFKQTLKFVQQKNVKDDHPVFGAGIGTCHLLLMSLLQ